MDEALDLVRRIKDRLDIVDVIGSYLELTKRGARYVALCPFHGEKQPSFSVNREDQFFYCFGCRKSGDIFDFVMALEGLAFPEALKLLADKCGLAAEAERPGRRGPSESSKSRLFKALESACRFFERNLSAPAGKVAREYLQGRQLPLEGCAEFRIGYAPAGWRVLSEALARQGFAESDLLSAGLLRQGQTGAPYDLFRDRLMIPIFDMQGRVVGFGGRVLDGSEPKYINSPETDVFRKSRLLFGLNRARRAITEARAAVLVEGYTDVLMAHDRGVTNVVATLGTALSRDHAAMLKRMADRIVLLFDGDSAGVSAAHRALEILLAEDLDVVVVVLENRMDPCDYFREHDAAAFRRLVLERGRDLFDFAIKELAEKHDVATAGGRTRIAREFFRLAGALADPIKQDLVLRRLAQGLDLREDLVRREFAREVRGQTAGKPVDIAERDGVERLGSRGRAAEDLLLGLLKEPDLVEEHREELECLLLGAGPERTILGLLLAAASAGAPPRPRELVSALRNDETARSRLIALLADERRTPARALVAEALRYFEAQAVEDEVRRVRIASREAGGPAAGDESLAELDRLLRERQKQRRRSGPF